jgi:glycosyltransferase involved in cell wall biosynthesis
MSILIATDAWYPQVNGVVRTLTSLEKACNRLGVDIRFLTPEGFPSLPVPTYPGLRVAIPGRKAVARRIGEAAPEAIHIATEGPIGWIARAYCRQHNLAFTTSYATRGVDTELFNPNYPVPLDLPRPIFMSVGRVAVEKNLEAFLSLDLPGSKVVIGVGPQLEELKARFPRTVFLGEKTGGDLASHIAAADVFVFPSLTDTFGVVQLEALACGVPIAAFPVTGPLDVVADRPIGALDRDLARASLRALDVSRDLCRDFALTHSWENCARQFINNLVPVQVARARWAVAATAGQQPARG